MQSPAPLVIEIANESATLAFGGELAALLPPAAVVALIGPLGAGKTRLVQAVARASGVEDGVVASPTFVLIHEYQGRVPIFHFDAYRLRDEDEFMALGPEEYFSRNGWSFVEWADRVESALPSEHLAISIESLGPNVRRFSIRATGGERYEKIVEVLRARFAKGPASAQSAIKE